MAQINDSCQINNFQNARIVYIRVLNENIYFESFGAILSDSLF